MKLKPEDRYLFLTSSANSLSHVFPIKHFSHDRLSAVGKTTGVIFFFCLGPEHTGPFVQPHVAAHCGGDIYSRRKPLFSSFGEHTAVCGSSVRQAVARPRHRQSVCIHNRHVAATCRPSVLGSATKRGHLWLNKVASVLGPLFCVSLSGVNGSNEGPVRFIPLGPSVEYFLHLTKILILK